MIAIEVEKEKAVSAGKMADVEVTKFSALTALANANLFSASAKFEVDDIRAILDVPIRRITAAEPEEVTPVLLRTSPRGKGAQPQAAPEGTPTPPSSKSTKLQEVSPSKVPPRVVTIESGSESELSEVDSDLARASID